jgi:hypothetical protein
VPLDGIELTLCPYPKPRAIKRLAKILFIMISYWGAAGEYVNCGRTWNAATFNALAVPAVNLSPRSKNTSYPGSLKFKAVVVLAGIDQACPTATPLPSTAVSVTALPVTFATKIPLTQAFTF